jgi:1-acyl-sn-glycerol-3-phosphate acyltransferase|tara:strand:+ start:4320 stop:4943 length:624 start_codon:yes stop_codon:yes gene_type:complete
MKNYPIKIVLVFVHLLIAIPLRFLFRIKKDKILKIRSSERYIIAANHPSKLDPFLILAALPFSTYFKLIPTRFLTSQNYLDKWYYRFFLTPLGCVSNRPKNKKSLELLEELAKKGETIFIFPRGELEKRGKISEPKVGAIYLEKNIKNLKIIPVSIKFDKKLSFKDVIKRKVKTDIKFRMPFRHKEFKDDLLINAKDLINRIEKDGK